MKKGQILEGYIERVEFPNKGFAVVEDEERKSDREEYRSGTKGAFRGE